MINVCYPFVGDSIGGSHISAVTLIKSIRETRPEIQPSVIVFCADKNFTAYLSKSNIPYYDIGLKLSKSSGKIESLLKKSNVCSLPVCNLILLSLQL